MDTSDKHLIELPNKELQRLSNITEVWDRLKRTNFEVLTTGLPYFDSRKLFIRGAVTRLGAFSNVGKSAMAYYLANNLLDQGHRGMIFSTEVSSPIILANLLKAKNRWKFWDIVNKMIELPLEVIDCYRKLGIYDSQDVHNRLLEIEAYANQFFPDFIIIDYVQGVEPKKQGMGNFERLTNYAFEVQTMAQSLNCCVIDLSQISNVDSKALKNKAGNARLQEINFKGSGDLFSSADIAIVLDRYRPFEADEDEEGKDPMEMRVGVRKHKYMPAGDYFTLICDFEYGTFKLPGETKDSPLPF